MPINKKGRTTCGKGVLPGKVRTALPEVCWPCPVHLVRVCWLALRANRGAARGVGAAEKLVYYLNPG